MDMTGVYCWTAHLEPYMGLSAAHGSEGLLELTYDEEREWWTATAVVLLSRKEPTNALVAGLVFRGHLEAANVERLEDGDTLYLEYVLRIGVGYARFGSSPTGQYRYPVSAVQTDHEDHLASFEILLDTPVTTGRIVLERFGDDHLANGSVASAFRKEIK